MLQAFDEICRNIDVFFADSFLGYPVKQKEQSFRLLLKLGVGYCTNPEPVYNWSTENCMLLNYPILPPATRYQIVLICFAGYY